MANPNDFVIENGVLKKYIGPGGDVVVPDSVTEIGEGAFEKNSSLTTVILPDGLTKIGAEAFCECDSLKTVELPPRLEEIGGMAFYCCKGLRVLHVPETVKEFPYHCFFMAKGTIVIHGAETVLSKNAFESARVKIVAPYHSIKNIPTELKKAAVLGLCSAIAEEYPVPEDTITEYSQYLKRQKKNFEFELRKDKSLLLFMSKQSLLTPEELETLKNGMPTLDQELLPLIDELLKQAYESTSTKKTENSNSVSALKRQWSYKVLDDGTITITNYKGMDTEVTVPEVIGKNHVTALSYQVFAPYRLLQPRTMEQTRIVENLSLVRIPASIVRIENNTFSNSNSVLKLVAPAGSYAEQYAKEHGIPFEAE